MRLLVHLALSLGLAGLTWDVVLLFRPIGWHPILRAGWMALLTLAVAIDLLTDELGLLSSAWRGAWFFLIASVTVAIMIHVGADARAPSNVTEWVLGLAGIALHAVTWFCCLTLAPRSLVKPATIAAGLAVAYLDHSYYSQLRTLAVPSAPARACLVGSAAVAIVIIPIIRQCFGRK